MSTTTRIEDDKVVFDLQALRKIGVARNRNGSTRLRFVAHVPEAILPERLLMLDTHDRTIATYWEDGLYMPDRTRSSLDLVMTEAKQP